MEEFIKLTVKRYNGGVWKNGSWGVRNQNRSGKPASSVHGTGRAVDLSWRRDAVWNGKKIKKSANGFGNYKQALQVVDFWLANADLFLIEEIHDYRPNPWGRGWRCNRNAWKVYQRSTIGNGAPGGDWFHVEIAPAKADDAAYYRQAFASVDGKVTPPKPSPGGGGAGGRSKGPFVAPDGRPELTRANESVVDPSVKMLQRILLAQDWAVFTKADGRYGNMTWKSVKAMQVNLGFTGTKVDGRYGPNTAAKLTKHLAALG
ncbi:MAG: peptidoglycan-binding domain-containing protein [Acidimicrobiia bacterium]|nr:peptidoglycan-binding domain-containing protein [Acidimicrobiia bacterium]